MEKLEIQKMILDSVKESAFSNLEEADLIWNEEAEHFEIETGRISALVMRNLREKDLLAYFWDGKLIIHFYE